MIYLNYIKEKKYFKKKTFVVNAAALCNYIMKYILTFIDIDILLRFTAGRYQLVIRFCFGLGLHFRFRFRFPLLTHSHVALSLLPFVVLCHISI